MEPKFCFGQGIHITLWSTVSWDYFMTNKITAETCPFQFYRAVKPELASFVRLFYNYLWASTRVHSYEWRLVFGRLGQDMLKDCHSDPPIIVCLHPPLQALTANQSSSSTHFSPSDDIASYITGSRTYSAKRQESHMCVLPSNPDDRFLTLSFRPQH